MKILYISHQREQSGYGISCQLYLKALKETGFEIASYPIILGKPGVFQDETETNDITNSDIVISHTLPHYYSYNGKFDKNIGIFLNESTGVEYTDWQQYISMMDQIWIPNEANKDFVTIPQPIDLNRYSQKIPKITIEEARGTFVFYTICEATKRKNLSGLITAYYQVFHHSDPVSLILKVAKDGCTKKEVEDEIKQLIEKIAGGMRLYENSKDYPRIFVIADRWSDEQILALHKYGNCYISTAYNESINLSLLDAMALNKLCIISDNDSRYYSQYGEINIVESTLEPCYGAVEQFSGHFTDNEWWYKVDTYCFANKMEDVYNNRKKIDNDLSPLSYQNIAKKMVEVLV